MRLMFFIFFSLIYLYGQFQPITYAQTAIQSQNPTNQSKPKQAFEDEKSQTNLNQNQNGKNKGFWEKIESWDVNIWMLIVTILMFFAMSYQAWISRNTARQQLRAYLTLSPSTTFLFTQGINNKFEFGLDAKNDGLTPARKARFQAMIKLINHEPTKTDLEGIDNTPITTWDINPSHKLLYSIRTDKRFDNQDCIDAVNGIKSLIFIGRVIYEDVFKKSHTAFFCYRLLQTQDGKYTWKSAGENISD